MPRFVFHNTATRNGERALYDTRRGRNEIIAMVDEEYVPMFEEMFNAALRTSESSADARHQDRPQNEVLDMARG